MNQRPHRRRNALSIVLALALAALPLAAKEPRASKPSPPTAPAAAGSCKGNEGCGKDEFCAKLFGRCADAGKCEAKPADCIEHGGKVLIRPVCGCDGKDYDSVCLAAIAGASVDHEGSCKPPASS